MTVEIREVEPRSVREEVVRLFWEHRHWPGATHDEYLNLWDWRYAALADGDARAWVAEEDGEIVGHVAVFPRRFRIGDTSLRGAVSGDLLVRRDRRQGLVAVRLLSIPHRLVNEGTYDLVYTLPNRVSLRLAVGLGWHDLGTLHEHVELRRVGPVLHRRLSSRAAASALRPLAAAAWSLRRRVLQRSVPQRARRLRIQLEDTVDPLRFDRTHWQYRPDRLVGGDTCPFIVRRFLQDPFKRRRLLTMRDLATDRLEGYVIVELRNGRAAVTDCQVNPAGLNEATAITLSAPLLPLDTETLVVQTLPGTLLAAELRALGFMQRAPKTPSPEKPHVTALWNPQHPQASSLARVEEWNLFVGAADA